jgi:hypothetical protein
MVSLLTVKLLMQQALIKATNSFAPCAACVSVGSADSGGLHYHVFFSGLCSLLLWMSWPSFESDLTFSLQSCIRCIKVVGSLHGL